VLIGKHASEGNGARMDRRKLDEEAIRSLAVDLPKALLVCAPLLLVALGGLFLLVVSICDCFD
jgi:hypothetical protein